ncbi:MAG TPA: hypothetical protein VHC72_18550 [Bryobacteraceae bacterium]|nr:hypothetical protein [Bryobacteraceae bacterium]
MRRVLLNIHIDRLTLEGKTAAEGRRIVAAMERRLTDLANRAPSRLLSQASGPHDGLGRLDAGVVPHGAGADSIGSQIANEVFRKMGGPRRA